MNQQKPLKFYENRPIINMEARFPPTLYNSDQVQFERDQLKKHNYQGKVYQKNNDYLNHSMETHQNAAPLNQNNYQSTYNFKTYSGVENSIFVPNYQSQLKTQENEQVKRSQKTKQNSDYPEIQVRTLANPKTQQSPSKIFKQSLQNDQFLTPANRAQDQKIASPNYNSNLSATNKSGHKPIFSNSIVDISEIRSYNLDNEQIKKSSKYQVPPLDNYNEDKIKRSYNPNNNSNAFQSPAKSINNKRIFGEGNDEMNKSASYIKNVELLNSEERIKRSKIFINQDPIQQQENQYGRLSYQENSQIQQQDKYARERALKEQELKKLTLEQAFCQNCYEFIHYENVDVVDRHTQSCKSIEEIAKIQTASFIQKERDLHNSFIDETDNKQIEKQQLIQIINSKLEKIRYLFLKMNNVLQDSDFLLAKPELKVYNIVEIKKSIEKIIKQDVDCRFIQSCLNNIENYSKEIDLLQHIYCTPESTQFLQIIKTIPEIVIKKMEYIQSLEQQQQQQSLQYQYY